MLHSPPSQQRISPIPETIGSSSIPVEKAKRTSKGNSLFEFDDLVLIKKISKAKFPVYLVESASFDKKLAMKVYLHKNGQPSARFKNEIRFSELCHPNVISIVSHKEEVPEGSSKVSYLLMEFAPYGDFFDLVMDSGIEWDDKLTRTYFHQLIEGIEYLHSKGTAHLDLKLENLLMGEDFILKIADFDLSYLLTDGKVTTKGTKNYRAPDVLNQMCRDPQAADIYSAAVILFVMKCGGVLPYLEGEVYKGIDLHNLLLHKPDVFWEKHIKIQQKGQSFFDQGFRFLITSMTRPDAAKRIKIAEIKSSQWYQGPIYSQKELKSLMQETWDHISQSS